MNTTKDTLVKARALIEDPACWTQHALARDAHGLSHPPAHPQSNHVFWEGLQGHDPLACSWCAIGALQHIAPTSRKPRELLAIAADALYNTHIANVNDELGHTAVLTIYDHAIKAATL